MVNRMGVTYGDKSGVVDLLADHFQILHQPLPDCKDCRNVWQQFKRRFEPVGMGLGLSNRKTAAILFYGASGNVSKLARAKLKCKLAAAVVDEKTIAECLNTRI